MKTTVIVTVSMSEGVIRDSLISFLSERLEDMVERSYRSQLGINNIVEVGPIALSNSSPTAEQVSIDVCIHQKQVCSDDELRQNQSNLAREVREALEFLFHVPAGLEVNVSTDFRPIEASSEKVSVRRQA